MDLDLLIKRFQEKDQLAYKQLYEMYWSNVCGVAYTIVRDQSVAEELTQDVFLKIWDKAESYNPAKGRFFTWILNITRNAAIDKLRSKDHKKQKLNLSVDFFVGILDTEASTTDDKDYSRLRKYLAKMTEKCIKLIQLLYFNGYTQSEASQELNIPLGTVKSRNKNCISRLRENLD